MHIEQLYLELFDNWFYMLRMSAFYMNIQLYTGVVLNVVLFYKRNFLFQKFYVNVLECTLVTSLYIVYFFFLDTSR